MATLEISKSSSVLGDEAKCVILYKNLIAIANLLIFIALLIVLSLAIYCNNMGYTQLSNIMILYVIGVSLVMVLSKITYYSLFAFILLLIITLLILAAAYRS